MKIRLRRSLKAQVILTGDNTVYSGQAFSQSSQVGLSYPIGENPIRSVAAEQEVLDRSLPVSRQITLILTCENFPA